MTLPQYIRDKRSKWLFFWIGSFSTVILYELTNRVHWLEPRLLHFDWADRIAPFWTWTVWIYCSEYVIFPVAYFSIKKNENIMRYFYAYMFVLVISLICFITFPVTFPRANYPVTGDSFSDHALIFLRAYMDTPANCLPSLHVSTSYISAFALWPENKKFSWLLIFWSTLVAISTMTAKQHYFIDVWTSFALTVAMYNYCYKFVKLKSV